MASTLYASAAKASRPAVTSSSSGLSVNEGRYTLLAALVINDLIQLCKLPANHVPVDFVLDSDDLDSDGSPAIVIDVGIKDSVGATSDIDALIDGSTVAQAGGVARMDAIAARRIAPVNYDRIVEVKVITAPATGVASAVSIAGTLLTRPAGRDD